VLKVFIRSIKNPLDQQNKDETKQAIKHPWFLTPIFEKNKMQSITNNFK
jgi:hypothetical protein